MSLGFRKSMAAVFGLVLVLALALSACGEEEKPTIIFSDLNWDSAQTQTAIAELIVSEGYGYPTEKIFGGTIPLMQALVNGDTNVTMEIWLPNQLAAYNEASEAGQITRVGNSLEDNWQSAFIIPQYTADANPGLQKVADIRDHMDLFVTPISNGKAQLLNCVPGWECEGHNIDQVKAHGLDDVIEIINPGSGEALAAEILAAFEKKEDVLFYYWGPTTLTHRIQTELGGLKVLEEPPYSEECWNTTKKCGYSISEVVIVVRNELLESAPDLVEMFEKWDFNAGNQLAAEAYMGESGADFPEVAKWFILNTEEWKSWVTADAAKKVIEAASAE